MATSKKVTELTALAAATADDVLLIVDDPSGTPTSKKITVKGLLESNATANLALNGHLVVTGRGIVNAVSVGYNTTPANSTAVPVGFSNNTIWSDGSYFYVVSGTGAIKRVAVSTW